MKLRQKLALVLASAMVVTAVPVVTMAASTNRLVKDTVKVKKDEVTTANSLKITFKDNDGQKEVFYLELENAEWNQDEIDKYKSVLEDKGITYEKQTDKIVKVTVAADTITEDDDVLQFPILAKVTGGDAKVTVTTKGNSSTVSKGSYVFATTAEKKMSVTVGDAKTFYTEGTIADITVDEAFQGSLADGGEFVIELDDSDFTFDYNEGEDNKEKLDNVEFKYGFYGSTKEVKVYVDSKDAGKLHVVIPAIEGNTEGTIILKGIKVKATTKKPETGDFIVDIKSVDDSLSSESELTNIKVATISEYGIYLKMKDDKAEDVKAGRIEEVEFEMGENVEDSMISNRSFEIKLENGHWDYKQLVKDADAKYTGYDSSKKYEDDDWKKMAAKIDEEDLAKLIMDNDDDWKGCKAEFDVDKDNKAIPETIIFTIGKDDKGASTQSNEECDKVKFKTKICVPVDKKESETVKLSISGRGIENEASVTAINIINPFNVTFEQAVLKVGLQNQVSGSLTITETDKDMFQEGRLKFTIKHDDEPVGIYLKGLTTEVSSGLKGTETGDDKGAKSAYVDINRNSKEASTITFKDLKFTTDRTVPEGTYDLEISGDAIDKDGHTLTIKDFIKISTTNTEDNTNALAKGTASFVVNESQYTLNGKVVTMDAPCYIQDPGYIMAPARYVATAFGIDGNNIMFGQGTVTIFAGDRTISLTSGSADALVNGNPVKLATKVVNKDGRIYVPASQLASLLGISSSWDATTKTATFENK